MKAVEAGWHWLSPTGTVAVWSRVLPSTQNTDSVPSLRLATTAMDLSGENDTPVAPSPAVRVCVMRAGSDAMSMTVTRVSGTVRAGLVGSVFARP